MKMPYTKSGKCGNVVWQRNRYSQICYFAFVPANPRTPSQMAGRGHFGTVSARWRTLTQEQRDVWIAIASTMKTKPRLKQCGVLTGFGLFVKVNVPLATQGKPQVCLPTEANRQNEECTKPAPKAIPGSLAPEPPTSNLEQPHFGPALDVGCSMLDVGCSQISRSGQPLLRYRSCTGVPPYQHRSSTLGGRWSLPRRSKRWKRFPFLNCQGWTGPPRLSCFDRQSLHTPTQRSLRAGAQEPAPWHLHWGMGGHIGAAPAQQPRMRRGG